MQGTLAYYHKQPKSQWHWCYGSHLGDALTLELQERRNPTVHHITALPHDYLRIEAFDPGFYGGFAPVDDDGEEEEGEEGEATPSFHHLAPSWQPTYEHFLGLLSEVLPLNTHQNS
jgi:hypothetical protein